NCYFLHIRSICSSARHQSRIAYIMIGSSRQSQRQQVGCESSRSVVWFLSLASIGAISRRGKRVDPAERITALTASLHLDGGTCWERPTVIMKIPCSQCILWGDAAFSGGPWAPPHAGSGYSTSRGDCA